MEGTLEYRPGLLARFFRGARWYGAEWYITVAGAFILIAVVIVTLLAPHIAPYDPIKFVGKPFTRPNSQFLMGTDNLGRDVFSRVVYGARVVLIIALLSSVFSALVGVPLAFSPASSAVQWIGSSP